MRHALFLLCLSLTIVSCDKSSSEPTAPEKDQFVYNSWDNEFAPTPTDAANPTKNIVTDYHAANDASKEASDALQQAIDDVSAKGGGIVYIPKGKYKLKDIVMKSDVKLYIDHEVTIHPAYEGDERISLFEFGTDEDYPISNVEVRGIDGRFKIMLEKRSEIKAIRVFSFCAVKDFTIANFHIEDVRTQLPMMAFGPTEKECMYEGEDLLGPTNGHISYASVNNCHYGYGLVQMQCIVDSHFEKLSGVGGVTLRAETGSEQMNARQRGGVFGLVGKDIYCKDGNAAAMASPHSMHGGTVHFENIIADGCGFAVRIGDGYISKDQANGENLTPGSYEKVTVKGAVARYGEKAQVKTKHHRYMPADLAAISKANQTHEDGPGGSESVCEPSPGVAAILNLANYPTEIINVKAFGFRTSDVMTGDYVENK